MKINKKNQTLLAVSLLALAGNASAHDQSGDLGNAASATDYYVVTCSNDGSGAPYQLYFDLTDLTKNSAPVVSAQVTKDLMAATTSDLVDTDTAAGPAIILRGGAAAPGKGSGPGNYFVTIDKSKAGLEKYHFTFHCQTQNGDHTGTDITTLQKSH